MTDRLVFEEDGHRYYRDGVRVPSVTQVIGHAGLADYSQVPQWMLDYKADIGRAAHKAIELDHDNDLDEETVDPRVLPYVEAFRLFVAQSGFRILYTEQRLYHPRHGYAGTLDIVALDAFKRLAIVENKTTAMWFERAVACQTVAYYKAWNATHPTEQARRRYALQLRPDGTYKLHHYDYHADDFAEFLGHLETMRKEQHSDAA